MNEIIPIGSDTIKVFGFTFGIYRYQVEHFDHNHSKESNEDNHTIKCIDFWDTIRGTRIYKFLDWEYELSITSAIYFHRYIEKDELKEMILNDVIDWKEEDPYEFKDRFINREREDYFKPNLFPEDKERVNHNYPELTDPYEKCPICGGELDGSVFETECCEDIFNSKGGYGYEGEPWGEWDEVHRCPNCDNLFYINVST